MVAFPVVAKALVSLHLKKGPILIYNTTLFCCNVMARLACLSDSVICGRRSVPVAVVSQTKRYNL